MNNNNNKYCVTYESDIWGKETQIVSTDLDFQEATELSAGLQADAFMEDGHTLKDGQYAVQPQRQQTKREYIAVMALQGILSSLNNALQTPTKAIRELVRDAIEATDILIDELGG